MIDLNYDCMREAGNILTSNKQTNYFILEKIQNLVSGIGYACSKKLVKATTYRPLFGNDETNIEFIDLNINSDECFNMHFTKKCNENTMTCFNSKCIFDHKPNVEYKLWHSLQFEIINCELEYINIISKNLTTPLFNHLNRANEYLHCMPLNLECKVFNKIITWSKSIFHNCPFRRIISLNFDQNDAILINRKNNLLFEIKNKFKECNLEIYETTEGLYLTSNNASFLEKSDNNLKSIDELILADTDANEFKIKSELTKHLNKESCIQTQNNLILISSFPSGLYKIFDFNNNELIILNKNGNLFFANCLNINAIKFKNTSECYEDFPVYYYLKIDMIKQGFLTRNKIITDYSRRIDCKSKIIEYFLNDKIIYRKNNTLLITDSHIKTLKLHANKINISNFNFIHNLNLINDINELNLAPNHDLIDDLDEQFNSQLEAINLSLNSSSLINSIAFQLFYFNIGKWILTSLVLILLVCSTPLLCKLIYSATKCYIKRHKNSIKKANPAESIEMDNLDESAKNTKFKQMSSSPSTEEFKSRILNQSTSTRIEDNTEI